jgi:hypothetical protein
MPRIQRKTSVKPIQRQRSQRQARSNRDSAVSKSRALTGNVTSCHLPSEGGGEQEAKLENSIAWGGDDAALDARDSRIDNERSGMEMAVGLAEGDLSSWSGRDEWTPDQQLHERASAGFVGEWNQLVSQTNWEKGRLIVEWRESLQAEDVPSIEYSDEAWSRLVGGVTSQHVGRLRRVYLKFNACQASYAGLYWSHFFAALEWDDAELWLQGALDNRWSVSQMRHQRWETMGQLAEQKPDPRDVVHGELDEDLDVRETRGKDKMSDFESGPKTEGPDFGDEAESGLPSYLVNNAEDAPPADPDRVTVTNENTVANIRPFESVGDLPEAFSDLIEEFKLSIIRYKTEGWQDVTKTQILAIIDGLRHLAESESDLVSKTESEMSK